MTKEYFPVGEELEENSMADPHGGTEHDGQILYAHLVNISLIETKKLHLIVKQHFVTKSYVPSSLVFMVKRIVLFKTLFPSLHFPFCKHPIIDHMSPPAFSICLAL